MIDPNRRKMILSASVAVIGSLAGCPDIARDWYRNIQLEQIEITHDDQYTIDLEVSYVAQGKNEGWRTLHDVRIVGLDHTGVILCEKFLGDISRDKKPSTANQSVTLVCDERPETIEVWAMEEPCDPYTSLGKATWEEFDTEPPHYIYGTRQCEE